MHRGMSARSDMDESTVLEEVEDIPIQEIDEMDCLKNASVKILLSFVEFLEEGECRRTRVWLLRCVFEVRFVAFLGGFCGIESYGYMVIVQRIRDDELCHHYVGKMGMMLPLPFAPVNVTR
jgi:hypothetical protein